MSKITLKQVREAEQKWLQSRDDYQKDPEWVEIRDKFKEITIRIRDRYLVNVVAPLREEYQRIFDTWESQKKAHEKSKETTPDKIIWFLNQIKIGVDWGPKEFKVRWYSKDCQYVIWTVPGHETWAGIGSTRYAPTVHYVSDLAKIEATKGYSLHTDCRIAEFEGRLTKEKLQELIEGYCI